MAKRVVHLVETHPFDPSASLVREVNFSDSLMDDGALGTTQGYPPRLKEALSHEVSVFDENLPGGTNVSIGSVVINNADGAYDHLFDYSWDSREVVVKKGYRGDSYASFTTVFVGSTTEIIGNGTDITLLLRDNSYKLAKPLQNNRYLGTGGAEGTLDLRNRLKPLCFGLCRNLTPVVVDPVRLILQVHDGAVVDITGVFDSGNAITKHLDYATYSALASATVPPGYFATCKAQGFLRLGAKTFGTLTADVQGQFYGAPGGAVNNIPYLAHEALKSRLGLTDADFDIPSIDEMKVEAPYSYEGVYLSEPAVQGDEFLETLMASVNGFWHVTTAGKIAIKTFRFDPPSHTLREQDITLLTKNSSPQPIYKINVNYSKNATIQEVGDFNLPSQTLNGYLKDNRVFVDTNADGTGGSYTYVGELLAFLNDEKVNNLPAVQFTKETDAPWLTLNADGTFTISDPGTDEASATLRASIGEIYFSETFYLRKSKEASAKNMVMTTTNRRFYLTDAGTPDPSGQTAVVTATLTNVTTPLTWAAEDNLGNSVTLTGSGNSRTLSAGNIINSPLIEWVMVTATSPDGSWSSLKVVIQRGEQAFSSSLLAALAAANESVDIYYQNDQPTGAKTDDLWFDTNDGNKVYQYNGTTWVLMADARIAQALTEAAGAQATADGKIKTFFSESAPTAESLGDLWYRPSTGALNRWNGSSWSNPVSTKNFNRGVWAAGISYEVGDTFTHEGGAYHVLTAHTSASGSPPPNANVQKLTASQISDGAGSTLKWTQILGAGSILSVAGNSASLVVTAGAYAQAVYTQEYFIGGVAAHFRLGANDVLAGITDDPATASYANIDYAFSRGGGNWGIYESGSAVTSGTGATDSSLFSITYDGLNVRYYKDGVLQRTVQTTATRKFQFMASFGQNGAVVRDVLFQPFTHNNWDGIGGSGRPSDYAGTTLSFTQYGGGTEGTHFLRDGNGMQALVTNSVWYPSYSKENFFGAVYVSGQFKYSATGNAYFGVTGTSVPTQTNFTDLIFGWDVSGSNYYRVYNGTATLVGTFTDADSFGLSFDGLVYKWWRNGTLVHSVSDTSYQSAPLAVKMGVMNSAGRVLNVMATSSSQNNWSSVGGDGRPSDNATSDLNLVSIGSQSVTIVGNTIDRNAGTLDYNACVRGDPFSGGLYAEIDVNTASGVWTMVALDDDATSSAFAAMRWTVQYLCSTGSLALYKNGVSVGSVNAGSISGKLALYYDNATVKVLLGGTQYLATQTEVTDLKLWPKWHDYNSSLTIMKGLGAWAASDNTWLRMTQPITAHGSEASSLTIRGSEVKKTGGSSGANAYVQVGSGFNGPCYVEQKRIPSGWMNLCLDNVSGNFGAQIKYRMFYNANDDTFVFLVDGVAVTGTTAAGVTPVMVRLAYDDGRIIGLADGKKLFNYDVPPHQTLYAKVIVWDPGDVAYNVGAGVFFAQKSGLFTLVGNNLEIRDSDIAKISGTHGANQDAAVGEPLTGTAFLSTGIVSPAGGSWFTVIGFGNDDTSIVPGSGFCWANLVSGTSGNATVNFVCDGVTVLSSAAVTGVTSGSRLTLVYDGNRFALLLDGVEIGSRPTVAGRRVWPKVYPHHVGTWDSSQRYFKNVTYGPWSDNSVKPLRLTAIGAAGAIVVNGNSMKKIAGVNGDYDAGVAGISLVGTAYVQQEIYRAGVGGAYFTILALDNDATSVGYANMNYFANIQALSATTVRVWLYSAGATLLQGPVDILAGAGSVATLLYDGTKLHVMINGVICLTHSVGVPEGASYVPKFLAYYQTHADTGGGMWYRNMDYGYYSNNSFDSIGGANKPENKADVTAIVDGVPEVQILTDYLGVPKSGQLSRFEVYKHLRNGVSVTSGNSWVYRIITGGINSKTSASGDTALTGSSSVSFEIASVEQDETSLEIQVTNGTYVRKRTVVVRKIKDPPPAAGGGGGGGGGVVSSASCVSFSSISSTTPTVICTLATITASSTTATLTASLNCRRTPKVAGTYEVNGKFQWNNAGVWTDIAPSVASNPDNVVEDINGDGPTALVHNPVGQLSVSTSKGSLTVGTAYEFRFLCWNTAGTAAMSFDGSVAVTT